MKTFQNICRAKRIPEDTAKLLGLNAADVRGFNKLEVRNEGDKSAEIYLLGSIGKSWWDDSGISEQEVRDALESIPRGKQITCHVNSEGGSVQDGIGIYNAFKERREDITCRVGGYALSIASVFPLGAGKVVSPKSAIWMTHKAWSGARGNADDMRAAASMLDEHDEMLSDIYAAETGKSKKEWLKLMEAETWIRGSKAVEFGLADEGDDEDDSQAQAATHPPIHAAYLSRCKNVQPEILNAISERTVLAEYVLKSGQKFDRQALSEMQCALSAYRAEFEKLSASPLDAARSNNNPPALTAGAEHTEPMIDKTKALALLKKWGVTVPDNASDADIMALVEAGKPEAKPQAAKPEPNEDNTDKVVALTKLIEAQNKRFEEMEKRARAEKVSNFKSRLDGFVSETRITAEEAKTILARAEKFLNLGEAVEAENCVSEVANRPPATFGAGALGPSHVQILSENPLEKVFAERDASKRHAVLAGDWDAMLADAQARDDRGDKCRVSSPHFRHNGRVQNANTYSATLVTAFLADGATTVLQKKLASLAAFTKNWGVDRYKPLATGQLKKVTGGSTTQTNATNFESGDSVVTNVQVAVSQYTQSFHVSNSDLNSGLRMADLVDVNVAAFGNKLMQVATAPITEANFNTHAAYVAAAPAFGWGDMATLYGTLKNANRRHAILDGEYIGQLNNTPTFFQNAGVGGSNAMLFGWDGIHLNTEWTGAGTGIRGFACDPQAIGTVIGLPLTPTNVGSNIPGGTLSEATFQVPGLNITVALYVWFSLSSRALWSSYDLMLGAGALDTTAGVVIKA